MIYHEEELVTVHQGDCLEILKELPENSIDSIITDSPYGIQFLEKQWDHGVPGIPFWKEMLRVAKPGAILMSFGGTRTFHRLACAIEDAGWEIKDCISYIFATGFPKSLDMQKTIAKINPEESHNWQGWKTAIKPAWEVILVTMKPLDGNYAENALKWGVAGFNIDGSRIKYKNEQDKSQATPQGKCTAKSGCLAGKIQNEDTQRKEFVRPEQKGRYPANLILDEETGKMLDKQSGIRRTTYVAPHHNNNRQGEFLSSLNHPGIQGYNDCGGASRFFYCAKASKSERGEYNNHPTVKPLSLMEHLCNLTKTPDGGIVLDPFAGSGTTLLAARNVGRKCIGIEIDPHYCEIIKKRLNNNDD